MCLLSKRKELIWGVKRPYAGLGVTILIGRQENEYIVPSNIASQFPSLQRKWDKGDPRTMRFPELDEDIGHTFIHYLYTGDYQTLKPSSTRELSSIIGASLRTMLVDSMVSMD
jgi:hypothetical protein